MDERCVLNSYPTICLKFEIDSYPKVQPSTAVLWLYKRAEPHERGFQRHRKIIVTPLKRHPNGIFPRRYANVDKNISYSSGEDWVSIDLNLANLSDRLSSIMLEVVCKGCEFEGRQKPFMTTGENRPLLVMKIDERRRQKRKATNSVTRPCAKKSFTINVDETPLRDIIMTPKNITLNLCAGSCSSDATVNVYASVAGPESSHTQMLRKIHKISSPRLCCTPQSYSKSVEDMIISMGNPGVLVAGIAAIESCVCQQCHCLINNNSYINSNTSNHWS